MVLFTILLVNNMELLTAPKLDDFAREVPMSSRRFFVSFIGSDWTNKAVRGSMKAVTEKWANRTQRQVYVSFKSRRAVGKIWKQQAFLIQRTIMIMMISDDYKR